jgi:CDP-diacylglycerol--glycerol-3-phosphate 3-phosphatidyltransferase
MNITLADRFTLARLAIAPLAVAAYLLLPIEYGWCFWVAGWLCAFAEYTDLIDGRVARQRGEVSDFGKLADPFCDVFYRISLFMAFILPAGGVGWPVAQQAGLDATVSGSAAHAVAWASLQQSVFVVGYDATGHPILGAGLAPWLPVLLMVLREVVAGALRAMTATKGLVLAARTSGKIKAWMQGIVLISCMGFPACWWSRQPWHLQWAAWGTWLCALVSVASILEYIWVNRGVLAQLIRRSVPEAPKAPGA